MIDMINSIGPSNRACLPNGIKLSKISYASVPFLLLFDGTFDETISNLH
jgi:hypothetical protein